MKKLVQFFSLALLGAVFSACHDNSDNSNANILTDMQGKTSVVITAGAGRLLNPVIAAHTGLVDTNTAMTLALAAAAANTPAGATPTVGVTSISVATQFANTTAAVLPGAPAAANVLPIANATFAFDAAKGTLTLTLGALALGTTNDNAAGTGVAEPNNLANRTLIFSGLSKNADGSWTAQTAVGTNDAGAQPRVAGATAVSIKIN